MKTINQAVTADPAKSKPGLVYAIKVRRQWPRSLCAICRQRMDHGNREYAVFQGDTGVLCRACAEAYAPELARAVEHMYAPRHITGMDLGGLPIDVVVRAEMPLPEVAGKLRVLATAIDRQSAVDAVMPEFEPVTATSKTT